MLLGTLEFKLVGRDCTHYLHESREKDKWFVTDVSKFILILIPVGRGSQLFMLGSFAVDKLEVRVVLSTYMNLEK